MSSENALKLALTGQMAVGKSTIALQLAAPLKASVRHCGDIVKARAAQLSTSPAQLHFQEHLAVDRESRTFAQSATGPIIIEGRFVDYVLHGIGDVRIFRLAGSLETRSQRLIARTGCTLEEAKAILGKSDFEFGDQQRKYRESVGWFGCSAIDIRTDQRTVREVCEEILRQL